MLETRNVRGNSGDCLERKEESWRERFHPLRNTSVTTNRMLVEIGTVKLSDGNKKQVIGDWRKDNPCYKFPKDLAELCSSVLWKVELLRDEISFSNYLLLYREIQLDFAYCLYICDIAKFTVLIALCFCFCFVGEDSFGFSTYTVMSSVNKKSCTSSFPT